MTENQKNSASGRHDTVVWRQHCSGSASGAHWCPHQRNDLFSALQQASLGDPVKRICWVVKVLPGETDIALSPPKPAAVQDSPPPCNCSSGQKRPHLWWEPQPTAENGATCRDICLKKDCAITCSTDTQ